MQGCNLRVFTLRQLLALFGQSRSLFLKGGETGLMQGVLDGLVPVPRGIDDRLVERGAEGLKSLAGGVFAASAEAVTEFAVQTGGFRIVPGADLGRIGGERGDIGLSGGFKQLDPLGLVLFAKPLAKAGSRDVQGFGGRGPGAEVTAAGEAGAEAAVGSNGASTWN